MVCADYLVLLGNSWASSLLRWKSELVLAVSIIFNTIISLVVLPELRKHVGYRSFTFFAIAMSVLIEMTLIYQVYISWTETE